MFLLPLLVPRGSPKMLCACMSGHWGLISSVPRFLGDDMHRGHTRAIGSEGLSPAVFRRVLHSACSACYHSACARHFETRAPSVLLRPQEVEVRKLRPRGERPPPEPYFSPRALFVHHGYIILFPCNGLAFLTNFYYLFHYHKWKPVSFVITRQ